MHRGETIKICELVSCDSPTLANETFEDCTILGPALLGFIDEDSIIGECTFNASGPDAVLLEAPDRPITGVIGLYRVQFIRCHFDCIAFIGSEEFLANARASFRSA